jgi:hypothetical protein
LKPGAFKLRGNYIQRLYSPASAHTRTAPLPPPAAAAMTYRCR